LNSKKTAPRIFIASLLVSLFSVYASLHAAVLNEYEIKAAFLYQFTKFVDWPQQAGEFNLCTDGHDPFGNILNDLENETVGARPIRVFRSANIHKLDSCQVVFIGSEQQERVERILGGLRGKKVLTVGEAPQFLEKGGVIKFVRRQNKIHFEISQENAERAGIKISSKLLSLAVNGRAGVA
jgi:hypothetical protein